MLTTVKECACYAVKYYKHKPKNIFKLGRTPAAPVQNPPFVKEPSLCSGHESRLNVKICSPPPVSPYQLSLRPDYLF